MEDQPAAGEAGGPEAAEQEAAGLEAEHEAKGWEERWAAADLQERKKPAVFHHSERYKPLLPAREGASIQRYAVAGQRVISGPAPPEHGLRSGVPQLQFGARSWTGPGPDIRSGSSRGPHKQ